MVMTDKQKLAELGRKRDGNIFRQLSIRDQDELFAVSRRLKYSVKEVEKEARFRCESRKGPKKGRGKSVKSHLLQLLHSLTAAIERSSRSHTTLYIHATNLNEDQADEVLGLIEYIRGVLEEIETAVTSNQ